MTKSKKINKNIRWTWKQGVKETKMNQLELNEILLLLLYSEDNWL